MKINFKTKILICIMFFILLIIMQNNSYAANVNINYKSSMIKGETQTITVSGSAVQWHLTLLVDGVAIATSTELDNYEGNIAINFSGKYTPTSAGNKTIQLKGSITEASDASTITSFPSKSILVSEPPVVNPEPTPNPEPDPVPEQKPDPEPEQKDPVPVPTSKSDIAILNYLGISKPEGYDFSGFKGNEDKVNWKASKIFPNEITRVYIDARPGENGKVISGGGWQNIKEGRQKLEIVVQSEDGKNKKTYYIEVEREVASAETSDENVADTTSDEIAVGLGKLEIAGMTLSPEFNTNEYKYTIEGLITDIKTLSDFKELITAEANFEGASIEVTSDDEEFKVGRNKIIITVKDVDGREIAIYNIVLKLKSSDTAAGIIKDNEEDEQKVKVDINKIIVISAIAIVSIFAIVITTIAYRQRKLLEENGLVGREDDYEEFDWGTNSEDNKVETESKLENEEEKKKNLDEFFGQRTSEFEIEEKDFETKKSRGGKRFQ